MKIKYVLAGVTLALSLGACKKGGDADKNAASKPAAGDKTAAPAGGADEVDAFMKLDSDKAVAFSTGTTCEEKAKSVGDWRRAHTAEYKAMREKINAKWGGGIPADVQEKYGTKIQENKDAVMKTMLDCSSNEAFGKMMDETKTE